MQMARLAGLAALVLCALVRGEDETCPSEASASEPYAATGAPHIFEGARFDTLPGFTRSVYERDHAVITPESRVYAPLPGWTNASAAHVVTPAMGAHFTMALVSMGPGSLAGAASTGVERFVFVLTGAIISWDSSDATQEGGANLPAGGFAYFPPGSSGGLRAGACGSTLIVYEREFVPADFKRADDVSFTPPQYVRGYTDELPVLETKGEVFALRKLLPASPSYDFNVHVMDFRPGEYLNVKEMHYNQHGMMLLQGHGIQRLNDRWYPVQAGDAIWMGPMTPQWYAALGTSRTRYILYKDTARDPLF